MKIAIYSRKSKFTGKGESTQNQIELCKEYAKNNFNNIEKFIVYEDEGFSGGNVDRPEYQNMIKHAEQGKFEVLMCYRLDRISRNISDFSDTIATLQNKDIAFISLREQFDTSTPMGRAMMYIASVFAQLERETIAERIRDNMIQLAKSGRWLGGITPTGFKSESFEITDKNGNQRKIHRLSPIQNELETIKIIYDKFLELKSLTKVETYCIQNNIKTRNNIDFTRFALRSILSNPVYATADKSLYNYFCENGFEIYADENDFTGQNGIMAYNKTLQKKNTTNRMRDYSEWIISIGVHEGTISSEKWINTQKIISKNKSKTFRKVKNPQSLLSGLLRCGNCNSFMRPKAGRISKNGTQIFYYMCELKEKSKRMKCNIKNINGNKLDKLVLEEIKKLSENNATLDIKISTDKINIETNNNNIETEITILEKNIKNNERAITNLVDTLSQCQNSTAKKYIINQIETLDQKTTTLKDKIFNLREHTKYNQLKSNSLNIIDSILTTFPKMIDSLDVYSKRNLLRTLVEKITWDGENIDLVMFGVNTKKE